MDMKEFKNSIHAMDKKDIKYLILHRGMMLNEVELQYGEVYSSDVFEKVPEHTIIGMIMGGWLYRGREEDVQRVIEARSNGSSIMQKAISEREKEVQVKEVKKARRSNP